VRFLPYILVAAMAAPILVWLLIDTLVIKGTSTVFAGTDLYVVVSLGIFTLLAFTLLATWMDRLIQRMR
jgi:Kef-type K+ transport system membrane component KefB